MDTKTLFQLSSDMAAIEDALWENGGELTEELAQALTETEQSLTKKTDGYISLLQSLASQEAMMKAQKERYAKLEKIAANAQKRLKDHLEYNMTAFGIQKLEGKIGKISISKSSAVEVNEEAMIAPYLGKIEDLRSSLPAYIQLPDPKVSKTVIKQMNKESGTIPAGAEIIERNSIRIR